MICRVWHGWTPRVNASRYDSYLNDELLPHVGDELASQGFLGFQVLRHDRGDEVEFVTMLWFDSIDSVKSFAGEDYVTPVVSEKAKKLLARYAECSEHFEVSGFRWPPRK